jgi:hypothetical protein
MRTAEIPLANMPVRRAAIRFKFQPFPLASIYSFRVVERRIAIGNIFSL